MLKAGPVVRRCMVLVMVIGFLSLGSVVGLSWKSLGQFGAMTLSDQTSDEPYYTATSTYTVTSQIHDAPVFHGCVPECSVAAA